MATKKATKKTATKKKTAKKTAKKTSTKKASSGKALVIVESPAKATTIGKYLGPGFVVKASVGHIMDLPKSKLGIDVAQKFKPTYDIIPGKEKIVKELRTAARRQFEQELSYAAIGRDLRHAYDQVLVAR